MAFLVFLKLRIDNGNVSGQPFSRWIEAMCVGEAMLGHSALVLRCGAMDF